MDKNKENKGADLQFLVKNKNCIFIDNTVL